MHVHYFFTLCTSGSNFFSPLMALKSPNSEPTQPISWPNDPTHHSPFLNILVLFIAAFCPQSYLLLFLEGPCNLSHVAPTFFPWFPSPNRIVGWNLTCPWSTDLRLCVTCHKHTSVAHWSVLLVPHQGRATGENCLGSRWRRPEFSLWENNAQKWPLGSSTCLLYFPGDLFWKSKITLNEPSINKSMN